MTWEILDSQILLDSPPWLRVVSETVRLPNGEVIHDYMRVEQRAFAAIFALTTDERVPFIRQYRHGPRAVSLELPAGYIDEGEPPRTAAKRELLEETGVASARWLDLGSYFLDGNRWCGQAHLFLALEAEPATIPYSEDLEQQSVSLLPLSEVRSEFARGGFINLATAAAIGLALTKLRMR